MSKVADNEVLHRRIHPSQIRPDGSVSSAAFTDIELSVDRSALRTADETLNGYTGYGLAGFAAGFAREVGQEVRPDPSLLNRAHALVIGKKTKGTQRQLAKSARWVVKVQTSTAGPPSPPKRQSPDDVEQPAG